MYKVRKQTKILSSNLSAIKIVLGGKKTKYLLCIALLNELIFTKKKIIFKIATIICWPMKLLEQVKYYKRNTFNANGNI